MYNANKKLTAVGYGRVSTDRQADGFSLTNEKKSIVSVADKYGFQLCKYFSDDGYSGTNTNRPGYKSMMRYLKENEIDVVLVYKLDRFHRNETNLYNDMKLFQERGVRFIAINDSIDTSDESTSLLMAVQSAIAANFSRNLSKLSWEGLYAAAQNCQFTGGKPPYGYALDRDTMQLVQDTATAPAVKKMFELYANGHSSNDICAWLKENGYQTDLGNDFKPNSLNTIFHNERYCGIYTWNKATSKDALGKRNSHQYKKDYMKIEGGIPAIVSKELFAAVQQRLKENAAKASNQKTARYYPLTGFMTCGKCGAPMCGGVSYSKGRPYYKYHCNEKCGNKPIRADYAEIFVIHAINQCLFSEPSRESLREQLNAYAADQSREASSEYHKLKCKIAGLEKSQENLLQAIEKGNAKRVLTQRLERVSQKKEQAELQLTHFSRETHIFTDADLNALQKRFTSFLQTRKSICNSEFLRAVIDKIVVDDENIHITLKSGIAISKSTKNKMKGSNIMNESTENHQDYCGILISAANAQNQGNIKLKIGIECDQNVWGYDTILDIDVPEELFFEIMAEAEAEPADIAGAPLTVRCSLNQTKEITGIESIALTDNYGGDYDEDF